MVKLRVQHLRPSEGEYFLSDSIFTQLGWGKYCVNPMWNARHNMSLDDFFWLIVLLGKKCMLSSLEKRSLDLKKKREGVSLNFVSFSKINTEN